MQDKSTKQENDTQEQSIEELFDDLEEIISKMDESSISLEDAFSLYEKGMKTIQSCSAKLDMVEKKMMMIASDGSEAPFEQ